MKNTKGTDSLCFLSACVLFLWLFPSHTSILISMIQKLMFNVECRPKRSALGRSNRMFRLSKKADYGLIALKHLAQHADESVSAREIAAQYHIPAELLAKVLQRLARKG